ncbi:MAG: carbohydrate kinase family protein [Candidatus Thorarchaeota archaeon]|jgi:sugar/nucleoside kinase (ribokinase family)
MGPQENLWPYVMFLPEDLDRKRQFIKTVLASKVAAGVLSAFDREGRVLQRDLVQNLPHSNKSIIAYLNALKEFGLINTASTVDGGKRIVYHELTKNGWGVTRLFSAELPADLGDLTASLLEDYLSSLVSLYRERSLDSTAIFDVFARTRARAILQGSQVHEKPEYVLFGACAYFTKIHCAKIPNVGGEKGCTVPVRYPGGSTVDLALSLADFGLPVTLVSSVGNDQDGWSVISSLVNRNVDVSHFVVEDEKHTNETIIVNDEEGARTLVAISDQAALSITSPSQVPWDIMKGAKVVYLGEVFLEVAMSIAAYAKANDLPIVYRCSPHFWKRGVSEIEPILSQIDVLIVSEQEWQEIKNQLGSNPVPRLQQVTDAALVVMQDKDAFKVFTDKDSKPIWHVREYSTDDISPWFMTGFLQAIAKGNAASASFEKAIKLEQKNMN